MDTAPWSELDKDLTQERRQRIDAIKARMREEERRAAAAHDAGRETAQVGGDPDPRQRIEREG